MRQSAPNNNSHPPKTRVSRGPRPIPRPDVCQNQNLAALVREGKSEKTLPNFCVFLG